MPKKLSNDEVSAVTMLLQTGKTISEIAKFADLDRKEVTQIARELDITPTNATLKRAKELYGSDEGLTYQDVAEQLRKERLKTPDGKQVHYLTVSTWVANHGWAWGGSDSGGYAPSRTGASGPRSRYVLRLSESLAAEINSPKAIAEAAEAAWGELQNGRTNVVAVATVRGAAKAGVTDVAAVKKALIERHGDEIRAARA